MICDVCGKEINQTPTRGNLFYDETGKTKFAHYDCVVSHWLPWKDAYDFPTWKKKRDWWE